MILSRPSSAFPLLLLAFALLFTSRLSCAQTLHARDYDTGSPAYLDLWVDPVHGDDARTGATRAIALRTFDEAWRRIPTGDLPRAYRVRLTAGIHPPDSIPIYLEARHGTREHPIRIESADGRGAAILQRQLSLFDCQFVYLVDFTVASEPRGDTIHLEKCGNVLSAACASTAGSIVRRSRAIRPSLTTT